MKPSAEFIEVLKSERCEPPAKLATRNIRNHTIESAWARDLQPFARRSEGHAPQRSRKSLRWRSSLRFSGTQLRA